MLRTTLLLAALVSFTMAFAHEGTNSVPVSPKGEYGAAVSGTAKPVALSTVIDAKTINKPVVVTGMVTDVCSAKGCWMMLKDGKHEIRVKFKDYGFFVPSSLKGKKVHLQGILKQVVVTEADRRHYAEDAGASKQEIAAIKGDSIEYTFEATGVKAP